MRVFLLTLVLILAGILAVHAKSPSNKFLIQALEAALAMKANFDYNAAHYRDYVNYETESVSRNLNELVAQALERSSTAAHGSGIRNCAATAADLGTAATRRVLEDLEILQDAALIYYPIILHELIQMNIFNTDLDHFYHQFHERLNESYNRLNDVLLQNVLNSLNDLIASSTLVFNQLDSCLNAVV